MTTNVRISLDTTEYIASHGKLPRGVGSWAFEITNGLLPAEPVFFRSATFAEARANAFAAVRLACAVFGISHIEVCLNLCP